MMGSCSYKEAGNFLREELVHLSRVTPTNMLYNLDFEQQAVYLQSAHIIFISLNLQDAMSAGDLQA